MRQITGFPSEWDFYDEFSPQPIVTVAEAIPGAVDRIRQAIDDRDEWIDAVRHREIPYDEYLRSWWWQHVRMSRLWWAEFRCEYHHWQTGRRCTATTDLDVHHLTYEGIGDEDWRTDLVVVCRQHHLSVHRGKL